MNLKSKENIHDGFDLQWECSRKESVIMEYASDIWKIKKEHVAACEKQQNHFLEILEEMKPMIVAYPNIFYKNSES